ncbi:MAG: DUF4347 domain-containing protein [Gemmataceae bacterium]|nr:DUF4347 domain-containing protein [Gemmataceae bacterium]
MIKLLQPSLALHSCDVPGYKYRMKETWAMPKGASASDVVYWILYAHDHTDYGLHNVVINCHGGDGKLYVGGDSPTINISNVGIFSQLRKKSIGTIWLVACNVAKTGTGKYFCEQLAMNSGCTVVAANVTQHVNAAFYFRCCPKYCLDNYEGTTYSWDSGGKRSQISQDGAGVLGVAA